MKMKIKFVIIIILFTSGFSLYCQHSEKFIELTQNLKPIDSIVKIKKFRNGKIKEIYKSLVYEYGEYNYEILSGKQQLFHKTGQLFLSNLMTISETYYIKNRLMNLEKLIK
jgi:protein associated with RNAse G/E